MKNLPEDELFNSVENRLRNYSELPDDEGWDRIYGAITPVEEPKWIVWTNRTAATLSLLILFFLFNGKNVSISDSAIISSNITNDKKKKDQAQSTISAKAELIRPGSGKGDNSAKETLTINSTDDSRDEYSDGGEALNGNSRQAINYELMAIDNLIERSPMNKKDYNMITKALITDSTFTTLTESKDSTVSAGNVLPPRTKPKKSKLTFYSMISPSLSFQQVTPDSEDGVVVDKLNSPGVISQERFGFSVEAGIQGHLWERFEFIVGLSFYQQSQEISYEEKTDGAVIESGDDLNYEIKPATTTRTFDYNMRNVGVQAGILYTLKQRGLVHKAGLVLQYQKGLIYANEDDVYDNSTSDYVNYQFLYRVEYTFRSGVGLFVQPAYTGSIIANESLDAPFKLKQRRAGLGVGIVYRF